MVGGMGQLEDLKSMEVYDPMVNHWSKKPPMNEICGKMTVVIHSIVQSICWLIGWTTCCLIDKPLRLMKSKFMKQQQMSVEEEGEPLPEEVSVNSIKAKTAYKEAKNSRTGLRMNQVS